ncbi:MAG: helicase-related protein, partial [Flavobacteriales bacterium]
AGELWDIYKLDVMVIPTNRPIQRDDRQDLIYRSKREKYNAVIEEVEKLSGEGRPVLVGTTTVEVSELLSKMLSIRKIDHQVLNAKMHQREAEIVANAGQKGTVTIATNMAGRGTDIKISDEIKNLGGLAIIGTERHDSRRVDRQLRGRAGRQGDPGSSQFYASMEDDLMRLFGSDRMAKMMDRLGIEEGEVIQHSMITKSIERAQTKVEENNFGIRKRLLEYDDVMNAQREVIYKRRKHALFGERMQLDIANMFFDLADQVVSQFQAEKDYEGFRLECLKVFGVDTNISKGDFDSAAPDALANSLYHEADSNYRKKLETLVSRVHPVIEKVYNDESNEFQQMAVPFTDGRKSMHVSANIEKAYNGNSKEVVDALERNVSLAFIDDQWKEHLRDMDDLRSNVQHARFEQKDPLLIYKFESYELFKGMVQRVNERIASFLMRCNLPDNPEASSARPPAQQQRRAPQVTAQKSGVQNLNESVMAQQRVASQSSH